MRPACANAAAVSAHAERRRLGISTGGAGVLHLLASARRMVAAEGLGGETHLAIWDRAQLERRFLVTQNLHFVRIIRWRAPTPHQGVLLVRLRSPGRQALAVRVREACANERVWRWRGRLVVLTDRGIRVSRVRRA